MAEIPFDFVIKILQHDFGDYNGLHFEERLAIGCYMLCNDTEQINSIILNNADISNAMRRFIADRISGNIKRPANMKATRLPVAYSVYKEVEELIAKNYTLTAAQKEVADRICLSTDAVVKMHSRVRKEYEARKAEYEARKKGLGKSKWSVKADGPE